MHDSVATREVFKPSGTLDIQKLARTKIELPRHIDSVTPPLTNNQNRIVSINETKDFAMKVLDRINACTFRSEKNHSVAFYLVSLHTYTYRRLFSCFIGFHEMGLS